VAAGFGVLAEQGEGKLVARIEQRDRLIALVRADRDPAHFLGVVTILLPDSFEPLRRLREGRGPVETGGGEAAQIGLHVARDFLAKTPAVREAAGIGITVGGERRNPFH
jgi:hypothetical protein